MSSLPWDINRDTSLDRGLAFKLVECAALGVKHYAPGWAVNSVAVHFQQADQGKSAGTDKFRINLIVERHDEWKLITLFGNCKYIDLKIRDQKDAPHKAYDFDRVYDASGELDCEFKLTEQVGAAQKHAESNGAPRVRFMPEVSQLVALDLDAGTGSGSKVLNAGMDPDNPFAAFAASIGTGTQPGNTSATLTPAAKPALPFGDW